MCSINKTNMELMQEHLPRIYEKFTKSLEDSSTQDLRSEASEVAQGVFDGEEIQQMP